MNVPRGDSGPATVPTAGELLLQLAERIDALDWDGLAELLAPQFAGRYVHTGETFDRAEFLRLNREYPGAWRFVHEEIVDGGDRAVLRARVSDATRPDVYYVASFAQRDADGLLAELVEVWADVVAAPPAQRRPG